MEKELYKQKASVQRIQICLLTVVEFHDSVTKDMKTTVSSFPCNIQSSGSVDHPLWETSKMLHGKRQPSKILLLSVHSIMSVKLCEKYRYSNNSRKQITAGFYWRWVLE